MRAAKALAQESIQRVGPDDDVSRCRLLALVAVWSARAGDDYPASIAFLQEAETLGLRCHQPKLTTELLDARAHLHYAYLQFPQTVEVGARAVGLRLERGELYDACDDYWAIMLAYYSMGRLQEALDTAQTLQTLATRVGHLPGQWNVRCVRTWADFIANGDLVRSEAHSRSDLEEAERTNPVWRGMNRLMVAVMLFFAGDWQTAQLEFDAAVGLNFESFTDRVYPSAALLARAYTGGEPALDRLQATASDLSKMPAENPVGTWEQLLSVVEGLAVLGHAKAAAPLYPFVAKGIENGAVLNYSARLWQMVAGICAAAGDHTDAAREHFETALRQAHALPHKVAQPDVRRWYAQMLLDHGTPQDRDKAHVLVHEAVDMYQRIGMPRHVEMSRALLTKLNER